MQNKILLSSYPIQLLSKVPLKTISQLIEAGVASVSSFNSITLPASTTSIFLFLQNQIRKKKNTEITEKQLGEILDCIVNDPLTVTERRASSENFNEQISPLQDQIIEVIDDVDAKLLQRYYVEYITNNQQKEQSGVKITLQIRNQYSVHNVMKLGLKVLNKRKQLKQINQDSKNILRKIVLPIFFAFTQLSSDIEKQTFQTIKNLLVSAENTQFQRFASQLFSDFYCNVWSKRSFNSQDIKQVNLLQRHLRLLEIIHFNIPYNKQVFESPLFKNHLKKLFTFTGENKGSIHLLSINLYQKITKNQQDNNSSQVFINLFNILSCYGVHLIKDVWPSFYSLLSNQQNSLFGTLQLIQIILHKLEFHENANVIKHCMNEILKNQQSNIIFEKTPSIVYNKIIPMLNLGVHYADSKFHMDSKIYSFISSFFLRYFNSETITNAQLKKHLKWFLNSTLALLNNDHALIALLMVFKDIKRRISWVALSEVVELRNLIMRSYTRYPIRKRYQMIDSILILIGEQVNEQQVKIKDLFQLFIQINEQYLLQLNYDKFTKIFLKYGDSQIYNYLNNEMQNTILALKNNSVFDNEENTSLALDSIAKIQFYLLVTSQLQKNQQLKQSIVFYKSYFHDLYIQYGQSLYKTELQRRFVINTYYLMQNNTLSYFNKQNPFSPHLQAILNLIALYATHKNEDQNKQQQKSDKINNKIYTVVYNLFYQTYAYNKAVQFWERQGQRVILARMFEWAYDNIHTTIGYNVVVAGLRARIIVNKQKQLMKEQYQKYENLFQQTLYQIYNELRELEQKNWKIDNYLSSLSRDKQLRLYALTSTILLTDVTHQIHKQPPNSQFLADVIDRYDFQHYEEVCWFIQFIYCRWSCDTAKDQVFANLNKEQQLKLLTRQLQVLLQNMVHNLEYSLQKKQIISICDLTMNILFRNVVLSHNFSPSLVEFTIKLSKLGQNYLIFHRAITLSLIKGLIDYFEDTTKSNYSALIPLLIQIMTIEEYRGFDSAVYCYNQNRIHEFFKSYVTDIQYSYHSTVPRFLFIHSFQKYILAKNQTPQAMQFYGELIQRCVEIALAVVAKQKMFLSGKNKIKLQIWQFLLVFQPEQVYNSLKGQKMNKILVKCVQLMGHNSIPEIRYYFEVFLMKILLNQSLFRCITNQVLLALYQGLTSFYGNVNRSVAFMITSGVVIKRVSILSTKDTQHFNTIKQNFIKVYNSLLTYVCSAVAYFRGISQYFCLQDISGCLQTKYISILRQNYMLDPDATILKEKLSSVILSYVNDVLNWNVHKQVLCKIPNENNNVVCEHYYMEVLKKIGNELANVIKNEDGFTAYRYIWKKNVVINQNQELQIENQEETKPEEIDDQEGVFQRKIDPTLQFIYGTETRSYLKLFVTSAKSVALIGHLARTGQIFGIQQLIIPDKNTIQLDSFKSISVTAERWLKITQWDPKNNKSKEQNAFKALLRCKTQGYQIVKLSKNRKKQGQEFSRINQKCVLVLDEQQWLPDNCWSFIDKQLQVGRYLSMHVEASIFIWSYFKKYVNMK